MDMALPLRPIVRTLLFLLFETSILTSRACMMSETIREEKREMRETGRGNKYTHTQRESRRDRGHWFVDQVVDQGPEPGF